MQQQRWAETSNERLKWKYLIDNKGKIHHFRVCMLKKQFLDSSLFFTDKSPFIVQVDVN